MYEQGEKGWICPKCGTVMAPWQPFCVNCHTNREANKTTEKADEEDKIIQLNE